MTEEHMIRKPCDCDLDGGCDGIGPILGRYCKIAEHNALVSKLALTEERSRLLAKTADEQAEIAESNAEKARALDWLEEYADDVTFLRDVTKGPRVQLSYCSDESGCQVEGDLANTLLDAVTKAMEGKS